MPSESAPNPTASPAALPTTELRRDVTVWGSYMWGFADVGADTFVALGLVFAITQGAAPLAFALAGLVYVLIGLAYTELAAAYPVAGGGQYYALRLSGAPVFLPRRVSWVRAARSLHNSRPATPGS